MTADEAIQPPHQIRHKERPISNQEAIDNLEIKDWINQIKKAVRLAKRGQFQLTQKHNDRIVNGATRLSINFRPNDRFVNAAQTQ